MDEQDLSKLWYVADLIVRQPKGWREILEKAGALEAKSARPSRILLVPSLVSSKRSSEGERWGRSTNATFAGSPAPFLLDRGEPVKDAGRALGWALENASSGRRASGVVVLESDSEPRTAARRR